MESNKLDPGQSNWQEYLKTMQPKESDLAHWLDAARRGTIDAFLNGTFQRDLLRAEDSKGTSLLMLAAYHGHGDLASLFLEAGADPNTCDHAGNSVLMGCAFKGHADILRMLLKHGADPTRQNRAGQTALQFAEMFGRTHCAQILRSATGKQKPASAFLTRLRSWLRFVGQWTTKKSILVQREEL
jgi:ankyrin repeat protein